MPFERKNKDIGAIFCVVFRSHKHTGLKLQKDYSLIQYLFFENFHWVCVDKNKMKYFV